MRHDMGVVVEERGGAHALGAIDDLVGEHKVAWADILAEGADGGESEDGFDAEGFERGDVGARGDGGRGVGVMRSVSGEKGDVHAGGEACDCDWGAGMAPGLRWRGLAGNG